MEPLAWVHPGPVTSAMARRAESDAASGAYAAPWGATSPSHPGRTPLHRLKTRNVGVFCPINQGEQSLQASPRGRTRPSCALV